MKIRYEGNDHGMDKKALGLGLDLELSYTSLPPQPSIRKPDATQLRRKAQLLRQWDVLPWVLSLRCLEGRAPVQDAVDPD
jgi:hypothetical protein